MFQFFEKMLGNFWEGLTGIFGSLVKMFQSRSESTQEPAALSAFDARPSDNAREPGIQEEEKAGLPKPSRMPKAEHKMEYTPEDIARIRIEAYGQQDIDSYLNIRDRIGAGAQDRMLGAEREMASELKKTYYNPDSRLTTEMRVAEAQRVIAEHQPNVDAQRREWNEAMQNPITFSAQDLDHYLQLNRAAEYASQNKTGKKAEVGFDANHMLVTLPEGISEAQINVTRMPSSRDLRVDIIPKDGQAVHIDNLTLAEVNSMVVQHPGRDTLLHVKTRDGIQGVNIAVVDNAGELVNPADFGQLAIGEGVGVNGRYRQPNGRGVVDVEVPYLPFQVAAKAPGKGSDMGPA